MINFFRGGRLTGNFITSKICLPWWSQERPALDPTAQIMPKALFNLPCGTVIARLLLSLFLFSFLLNNNVFAQSNTTAIAGSSDRQPKDSAGIPTAGIKWTTRLSWEQIKQKAKVEHKYIFLDCYTTWCGPCKEMDKHVYTNDTVGQFFNEKFISVRVQFDKTKNDNDEVKFLYPMVNELNERYVIEGYPTFLFFTPNGEAVYKEAGYRDVQRFMKLANWVHLTKDRIEDEYIKYTRLLQEFKNGKINYAELPFIATNAKKRGDTISRQVLRVHEEYVLMLPKEVRYTKENIEFWSTLNLNPDRKIVQFFNSDGKEIDKIIGKNGFAKTQVDKCIQNSIVTPFIEGELENPDAKSGVTTFNIETNAAISNAANYVEPDWRKLKQLIRKNFNSATVKRNILKAKAIWYQMNSNWPAFAKISFEKFKKNPPDFSYHPDRFEVNNVGWNIFLYIRDKELIDNAIIWMEKLVMTSSNLSSLWSDQYDTYANLLYKAGRKEEAIHWQEKAVSLAPDRKSRQKALEHMKKGEPTYGVQPLVSYKEYERHSTWKGKN